MTHGRIKLRYLPRKVGGLYPLGGSYGLRSQHRAFTQREVYTMNKVLTFTLEKETKGTWRYTEVLEGPDAVVGTLYIKKSALTGDAPKTLTVRITEGE
jgi:hypothetical protein